MHESAGLTSRGEYVYSGVDTRQREFFEYPAVAGPRGGRLPVFTVRSLAGISLPA